MKKLLAVFCLLIITHHNCLSQIKNTEFAVFVNKITAKKMPRKCKTQSLKDFSCFRNSAQPAYVVSLEEAKKYFEYSDKDYYVMAYDYDMDEDRKFNFRKIENPPFVDNKILQKKYIAVLYYSSLSCDMDECDTAIEILKTFTLFGDPIDKITIRGHYTQEFDWIDFVFLSDSTFRIFHYIPYLENFVIKDGGYYIIDKNKPQTVVEINDYEIQKGGKIKHIETHQKQYLTEFISYYKIYQENSDDPMNNYDE
ncbi:MAG: hypothetical protein LBG80_08690 [Bacteroidales bacterium]|jgi:hypothetical protein|nr:hypothetical protein [Bacteroidales bacterium]